MDSLSIPQSFIYIWESLPLWSKNIETIFLPTVYKMRVSIEWDTFTVNEQSLELTIWTDLRDPKNIIRDLNCKHAPAGLLCLVAEVHHMKNHKDSHDNLETLISENFK